jgi:hypothetical protein
MRMFVFFIFFIVISQMGLGVIKYFNMHKLLFKFKSGWHLGRSNCTRAAFNVPHHPNYNGEARVRSCHTKKLRLQVFPTLPFFSLSS